MSQDPAKLLVFHHWQTRSVRIVWLCEELNIPYDLDVLASLEDVKSEEYKQKNPNSLLPAVKVEGEFLYESGALMQFIMERYAHGRLEPAAKSPARGKFLQWLWFLEATFNPPISEIVHHTRLLPEEMRVKEVLPYEYELARQRMQTIENQLRKTHYLLGNEFTAVDIMCGEVLTIAEGLGVLKSEQHPAAYKYLLEMKARPGYQKATAH